MDETGVPAAVLRGSRTALLTTFRRDGRPVATAVSIAIDGNRAYFVTAVDSGKARRLARCDHVAVAPCTVGGDPLGPVVTGSARLLQSTRLWRSRALRPTGSLFWSWLLYRLQGRPMALYEIELDGVPGGLSEEAPRQARRRQQTPDESQSSPITRKAYIPCLTRLAQLLVHGGHHDGGWQRSAH